ncbi:MAG: DUF547 domain-containing protein [Gemmatimonadota bacterium]
MRCFVFRWRGLFIAPLAAVFIHATAVAGQSAFDHTAFDRLLKRHVTHAGMVDYDAFAADDSFDGYLAGLAGADLDALDESERLALWINAYNAYTIELINRHEERESIRNINKMLGLFAGNGPWDERLAEVAGRTYTLNEIEHEIIRARFDEPRIHFALVCAAVGCPPLRREAYVGARLDEQLDDQARRFLLESPEKNRIDVDARRVHLSPIFDWYAEDFGDDDTAVGRALAAYFPPGPERELLLDGPFEIEYTHYDWSLNARP